MSFSISTAVRRGRPTAANDNVNHNLAAKAERADTVRALRQRGFTFRAIADRLSMDARTVRRAIAATTMPRRPIAANDNVVRRSVANNGGASTTSGMVTVSLARVPTLEKPEIYPELAVAA